MTNKSLLLILLLIFLPSANAQAIELSHTFLSPIYNGSHELPTLTSGDIDGDQKPEIIIGSQYGACVTIIDDNLQKIIAPKPFSYTKGYINIVATADLNHNGVNEIIIGHEYLIRPFESPSMFIVEKRNNEYQVIWESHYLGETSRFFVHQDKVIIYVDDKSKNIQRLHLLEYQNTTYQLTESIDIKGYPVYLGPLGNMQNTLVICSKAKVRGPIYKFGSYVDNISLKDFTLLDFSTGHFKPQKPSFNLPEKDIWDFACYDLNQDGQDELILGAYDEDNSIVEIYSRTSKGYQQVFSTKTPSGCYHPKGLILIDHDGDQVKEVLTVDGIMVHYNNDKYIARNFFSQLHLGPVLEMANILACDLNQDKQDEIILFVARDTEDFQNYDMYEAYYIANMTD